MLTCQAEALDVHDAGHAPELCWAADMKPSADYPLLDIHSEGVSRRVGRSARRSLANELPLNFEADLPRQ